MNTDSQVSNRMPCQFQDCHLNDPVLAVRLENRPWGGPTWRMELKGRADGIASGRVIYLWIFVWSLIIVSQALGQLAPSGAHYAARPNDTGYGGTTVDATGNFPTSISLDLPSERSGLPIPLQIVYGAHHVGAVGLGWDIPLSYLQHTSTYAHRRPSSPAGVIPTPRERTTLSLLGQNVDLIEQGPTWVARVGTLELLVQESGNVWFAYDGQGRTYRFESADALAGTGVWLLRSISVAGGSRVELAYNITSVAINGGTGISIDLLNIAYNMHEEAFQSCAKNQVSLSYAESSGGTISMSMLGSTILVRQSPLAQIDVTSRTACDRAFQRLRRYSFQYLPDADTGLPQLSAVNQSGRQGTPEESMSMPVAAYEYGTATSNGALVYGTPKTIPMPPGINGELSGTAEDPSVHAPESGVGYAMWQTFLDVTGDGKPDLVFGKDNKLWVAKGNEASDGTMSFGVGPQALAPLSDKTLTGGALSQQSMSSRRFNYGNANRNTEDVWREAIDVNGDGRIDIVDAAEEANHWVVYINTPGGPSGIKWERRSYSIECLLKELIRDHHIINGDHLPLSRHTTGTALQKYQCWLFDGNNWKWWSQGFSDGYCPGKENYLAPENENTYVEWDFTDLNGDGYPDFVFDTLPADWQFGPPVVTQPKPAKGTLIKGEVTVPFTPGIQNQVKAAFNVLGVRFDTDQNPFSESIDLAIASPELGVSDWTSDRTCQSVPPTAPCVWVSPNQYQFAGLADVNGDGLLDRVVDGNAYLGVYANPTHIFSPVYITLPNLPAGPYNYHFLAEQHSTEDVDCKVFGSKAKAPIATQTQGLRDLTGDGIPDYYDTDPQTGGPRVWIGTGTGFRPPIPIKSTLGFQLSLETEDCDGRLSQTDRGLYDLDGDGKPEIVGHNGNTFVIAQLTGGRVPGTPESGRLTSISNGYGAKTTINYLSAKQYQDSPLPFPEIVVGSVSTAGTHDLGGTLAGSSYAYDRGSLVFNSALDRFVFPGYYAQVAIQLSDAIPGSGNPYGQGLSGAATVTHILELSPFSLGMTKQQRWFREQVVGQVHDVLTLRAVNNPDPWSMLDVTANDYRVIGQTSYAYDAKYYEVPASPVASPVDCFDIIAPLDFQQTIASLNANAVDVRLYMDLLSRR